MSKAKAEAKTKNTETPKKARKARVASNGGPTKIAIATTMLMQGTTMKQIEEVTGDTSYAAVRGLEKQGYTFDKTQRDSEGRIFYKAVPAAQNETSKAA